MMQEKAMVSDALNTLNSGLKTYTDMISQSENQELRSALQQMRNETEKSQYELYQIAKNKNYYQPAGQASQNEINSLKSTFSGSSGWSGSTGMSGQAGGMGNNMNMTNSTGNSSMSQNNSGNMQNIGSKSGGTTSSGNATMTGSTSSAGNDTSITGGLGRSDIGSTAMSGGFLGNSVGASGTDSTGR